MPESTVVELVEVRDLTLDVPGSRTLVVRWSDGTISNAVRCVFGTTTPLRCGLSGRRGFACYRPIVIPRVDSGEGVRAGWEGLWTDVVAA